MAFTVIDLEGEPYDMGYSFGQQTEEGTHGLAEERCRLSEKRASEAGRRVSYEDMMRLAAACLTIQKRALPDVHREFMGIADGARIPPEELLIGNGYTDFRDALVVGTASGLGCTSFVATRPATGDGNTYAGQTWDMDASAERFVLAVRRKPRGKPRTISLTTAGCLSLIGMNEVGLTVGNNNLEPRDARPGAIYLAMIHDALGRRTLDEARSAVLDAPRASGHHYYLADENGRVAGIETTAERHAELEPNGGIYVHANHFEAEELQPLAQAPPGENTLHRRRRMEELLSQASGQIGPEMLQEFLADGEGGEELSICRHGDVRTCAAAVMCPQTRALWFCLGPPDEGEFEVIGW